MLLRTITFFRCFLANLLLISGVRQRRLLSSLPLLFQHLSFGYWPPYGRDFLQAKGARPLPSFTRKPDSPECSWCHSAFVFAVRLRISKLLHQPYGRWLRRDDLCTTVRCALMLYAEISLRLCLVNFCIVNTSVDPLIDPSCLYRSKT